MPEASLPIAMQYNSGAANHFVSPMPGFGQITQDQTSLTSGGWGNTLPYVTALFWVQGIPQAAGTTSTCEFSSSYIFYDPSGGAHSFNIGSVSNVQLGTGAAVAPGYCNEAATSSSNGSGTLTLASQAWDDAYTLTVTSGTPCNGTSSATYAGCQYANFSFTIADNYGNVYSFPWNGLNSAGLNYMYPSSIQDRNGNITQISGPLTPPVGSNSTGVITVTDSAGRTAVTAPAPSTNSLLVPPGFSGAITTAGGLTYSYSTTGVTASYTLPYEAVASPAVPEGVTCNPNFTVPNTGGGTLPPNTGAYSNISGITLPNGGQYGFKYNDTYGLISEIDYPDGGKVVYTWKLNDVYSDFTQFNGEIEVWGVPSPSGLCSYIYKTPALATREVFYGGSTTPAQTQSFAYGITPNSPIADGQWTSKVTTVTTTDVGTNLTSQIVYNYANGSSTATETPVESSVAYFDWGNTTTPIKQINYLWNDPYQRTGSQTLLNGTVVQETISSFSGNLVTTDEEFNSGQTLPAFPTLPSSSAATRITNTSYLYGLPCQVIVTSGSGAWLSESDSFLDNSSSPCGDGSPVITAVSDLPTGTHDETKYAPSSLTLRGNPTTVRTCLTVSGTSCTAYATTTLTYDETGQVTSRTDPCGNASCADMPGATSHKTTYSYTDSPLGASNSNAYLTQITYPTVNGVTPQESFTYDYAIGQLASATDVNGQTTTYTYNDPAYRPTEVQGPSIGGYRPTTTYIYNDSAPTPSVTTSTLLNADGDTMTSVATRDGMNHVIYNYVTSDPYGTDTVATTYDGEGNVSEVSTPYRSTSDPTYSNTLYSYDALGRKTKLTHSSDSSTETWSYSGLNVTFTNESGSQWLDTSDGLGRLTTVLEPNGVATTPTMETDYNYDAGNNLLGVTQYGGPKGSSGPRSRTFTYDALSRMTSSWNAEQTVHTTYIYDANSNLSSKTDARGVTTSFGYDGFNRLLSKVYSNDSSGTPVSCYQYGTTQTGYTIGKMIGEWTQAPLTTCSATPPSSGFWAKRLFLTYDPLGDVLTEQQLTPANAASGAAYTPSYTYDLTGNVLTANAGLPSGIGAPSNTMQFTYGYDAADRLSAVTSSLTEAISSKYPTTLFQAQSTLPMASYSAIGLTYAQYGVNKNTGTPALIQTRAYDSRARVSSETDSATAALITAATGSRGSFAVAGTEQSYNPANTHATGTISINSMPAGPESGVVTVDIDGENCQTNWSESPNGIPASSLASSIASTINTMCSSYATAVASGSSIIITSSATGAAANYSISVAQTYTNDKPVSISAPAALTGGTNGPPSSTVYDTGTVSVDIGGQIMDVSYGESDNPTTIAGKLQTAINTSFGSLITVTPSAGNLTLVSSGSGLAFDYDVSGSDTYNTASFAGSSFTITNIVSMTGGTTATYNEATVYDYSVGYTPGSNVSSVTDSVTGTWAYTNDTLNRLVTATPSAGPATGQFTCLSYDGFGNRTASSTLSSACPTLETSVTPTATYNTNNYVAGTTVNSATNGFTYDNAGDVTNDNLNQYAYDAEGRLCAVSSRLGGNGVGYIYDAGGTRVAKGTITSLTCNPATDGFTVTNSYVLGLGGEQFSEVTVSGSTDTWAHTNIFAGGKLLATYNGTDTYFDLTDWLGTKRAEYTPDGLSSTFYSGPFGGGLSSSGNAVDASEQHFTGKERDAESGNDYFGARCYASSMGRFMSPEPVGGLPRKVRAS
jgi:RHS repeat-associated protein